MKKLFFAPLFLTGLAFRIAFIYIFIPSAVINWYVPFLDVSLLKFTFDPWTEWVNDGGTHIAFPYGYAMWFVFLPLTITAKLIGFSLIYAYAFTLLVADFGLLLILRKLLPNRDRLLLAIYWLSPIVMVSSYCLGLNDIIPVLLLTISLYYIKKLKFQYAGVFCIAAISAKLSMILALPFIFIYIFNNRRLRILLPNFFMGLFCAGTLLVLPFIFSSLGLYMLFSNPEIGKIYRFAINLGGNTLIYVVPLVYILMVYTAWRIRRPNYDLFHAILGISFILVVLLTPASPGWFVWAMPLLVSYQAMSGRVAIAITGIFSFLYVFSTILTTPIHYKNFNFLEIESILYHSEYFSRYAVSMLHTIMIATGIILVVRIWRESVIKNDYFRISRKPLIIGISGDSGAGKDTLSDSIKHLFGNNSVTTLSGDDYHLWDRHKPMWQVMTHLNPIANDLESFGNDLLALADGKDIHSRHYDHHLGKKSKPIRIKSNDFIIASGLHALYLPIFRENYDLSVYLDIDEGLRKYFKINRDVKIRGHKIENILDSFARREPDSVRFIRPQALYADLIISLQPIHPRMLENADDKITLRLKLIIRSRRGLNERSLLRVLVGICGLHVDMAANRNGSEVVLAVEGETSSEDIALASEMLCPRIFEFLDIYPKWENGINGLIQLIILAHIEHVLIKRIN